MIEKILVPVDGSDNAYRAIEFAGGLAIQNNATIHLLHVVKPTRVPSGVDDYIHSEGIKETPAAVYLQVMGNQIMAAAENEARKKGVKQIETATISGDPAEEITRYAKDYYFDMIVMGSQRLGRVVDRVCRLVDRTCVIVKKGLLEGKRILAVDDEKDVLDSIEELLGMCDVTKSSTFDEAKALLENQQFDLAILDIMGVNGYELLKLANKKKVIAVMLTAHALSLDDTIRSYKEGAASYIPKDEMSNMTTFLTDIFEARERGKHFWWRWYDRLGSYYNEKFGAGLKIKDK